RAPLETFLAVNAPRLERARRAAAELKAAVAAPGADAALRMLGSDAPVGPAAPPTLPQSVVDACKAIESRGPEGEALGAARLVSEAEWHNAFIIESTAAAAFDNALAP